MLHIPWPNQHWDAIHDRLVQRNATEKDLASEKIWVFNCFGKTRKGKIFGCWKSQHRSITTLPIQLSKKQTDPANTSEEKERHKLRNAVGKGECRTSFEKTQKIQLFPSRTSPGRNRQKLSQQASQLSAVPSIKANILAFPSSLFRQGSKKTFCTLKNQKTATFISHNSTKNKFGGRKVGI